MGPHTMSTIGCVYGESDRPDGEGGHGRVGWGSSRRRSRARADLSGCGGGCAYGELNPLTFVGLADGRYFNFHQLYLNFQYADGIYFGRWKEPIFIV
jgi:hypothetical protein